MGNNGNDTGRLELHLVCEMLLKALWAVISRVITIFFYSSVLETKLDSEAILSNTSKLIESNSSFPIPFSSALSCHNLGGCSTPREGYCQSSLQGHAPMRQCNLRIFDNLWLSTSEIKGIAASPKILSTSSPFRLDLGCFPERTDGLRWRASIIPRNGRRSFPRNGSNPNLLSVLGD
jgi:hypothetical protein